MFGVFIRIALVLAFVALLLALISGAVVAVGSVLAYFVPAIPFEFACVIAALTILVEFALVSSFLQLVRLINTRHPQLIDDELVADDDDSEEFAEQVAEIVSERLEPHFQKLRRPKFHTR